MACGRLAVDVTGSPHSKGQLGLTWGHGVQHKRDEAREAAKMERQAEVKLKNDEARAKASHRMQATLQANRTILKQRRAEYDQRQRETEARRLCAPGLAMGLAVLTGGVGATQQDTHPGQGWHQALADTLPGCLSDV